MTPSRIHDARFCGHSGSLRDVEGNLAPDTRERFSGLLSAILFLILFLGAGLVDWWIS